MDNNVGCTKGVWCEWKVAGRRNRLLQNAEACIRVGEEKNLKFGIKEGIKQGCEMSSWLFNLYTGEQQ